MPEATSSSETSWTDWVRQHGPRLLLMARQWTRSASDAEDVVQEAFVRFWRHQRHLPGSPLALLATSIRRCAWDFARRETRRTAREQAVVAPLDDDSWFEPAPTAEGGERQAALEAALRRLPENQREVLVLKIWQELTFEQIGEALGLSPNTAASRYRYALAALRKALSTDPR
jgi:RNA polymerase sigma-70 factor (ECF subfamily)